MYDTVLVATDGGPGSEAATARTLGLAETFGAAVHALSVVDTRPEPPGLAPGEREEFRGDSEKRARSATERIREQGADRGLTVVRDLREGTPHREILRYAGDVGADLVALGTRRAGEGPRLGSTAGRVIALADVPVLAVPPGAGTGTDDYGTYDHVVLATDGSDAAERAAEGGIGIAERYGADCHAVYVVDERTYGFEDAPRSIVGLLKEGGERATGYVADAARERSVPVTAEVLRGVPDEELLDYAGGVDADLVTLGTRGRGGAPDPLLGSVTERVVRRSPVPLLIAG